MEERRLLNEKDSLELITQMICNAQQRMSKIYALPLLVFGYLTVIISLIVWYLIRLTGNSMWSFIWILIPILGFAILFLLKRLLKRDMDMVRTFVDKTTDNIWMVCGITVSVGPLIPMLWAHVSILFFVALVIGIATTLTGLVTKVYLLAISGGIAILSSFLLPFIPGLDSILVFAAIFLIMQLIPGHILYSKAKR